jgi:hypothetical protein
MQPRYESNAKGDTTTVEPDGRVGYTEKGDLVSMMQSPNGKLQIDGSISEGRLKEIAGANDFSLP